MVSVACCVLDREIRGYEKGGRRRQPTAFVLRSNMKPDTEILGYFLAAVNAVLGAAVFTYHWRRSERICNFFSAQVLAIFLLPLLLLVPFAASEANIVSTGPIIPVLKPAITQAIVITQVGLCCLWGGYLFCPRSLRAAAGTACRTAAHAAGTSSFCSVSLLVTLLSGLAFLIGTRTAFSHDLREIAALQPAYRPFFNLFLSAALIYLPIALIEHHRHAWQKLGLLSVWGLLAMSGSRRTLLLPLLTAFLMWITEKKRFNRFLPVAAVCLLFISAALVLEAYRYQMPLGSLPGQAREKILYGNTFSDLRDFGWILHHWNQTETPFLWGKSYIASMLGFVPSRLLPVRDEWSYYKTGLSLVFGQTPAFHGGLRGGLFAEAYFNFWYLGVVLLGVTSGMVLRALGEVYDFTARQFDEGRVTKEELRARIYTLFLFLNVWATFLITSSFFANYALLLCCLLYVVVPKRRLSSQTVATLGSG